MRERGCVREGVRERVWERGCGREGVGERVWEREMGFKRKTEVRERVCEIDIIKEYYESERGRE